VTASDSKLTGRVVVRRPQSYVDRSVGLKISGGACGT
jgi:hypothetical protein